MEFLTNLVSSMVGWVNRTFGFADYYTAGYSRLIVYGALLFILSKILKVKIDYKTGGN